MNRSPQILFIKFTAALASITYELILAQTLSAFLSNTVLRYSVTIGLYMASMGAGAFFVERRLARNPALTFWRTETVLTLLGAGVVPLLFVVDSLKLGATAFLLVAHVMICLIGFLTGFELPLALELSSAKRNEKLGRNAVLAVDYLGAFIGTVIFALVFFPLTGLIVSAWLVSLMNALAALILVSSWSADLGKKRLLAIISWGLLLLTVGGLLTSGVQEQFFIGLYLR